ncbi:MAG: efflux RND transporter periplasmic adaptor subunit [Emcibacteraceae bacterium]|nr:efflux RND transporter periplasmic adaptor subunit [Emcibacteraceae bacterium]
MSRTSHSKIQKSINFFTVSLKTKPVPTITLMLIAVIISGLVITRATEISSRAIASTDGLDISKALTVNTILVKEIEKYSTKQKISGQVVAARESDHGFDRSGILAEVLVDEGDQVKKGDILAKLDMRKLDATQQELNADLAAAIAMEIEAKATLTRVQTNYERYEILKENGHISQARFDQAKNELDSAKARDITAGSTVTKVNAALASLNVDREMSSLRARFDGNVIARYRDEGASFGMGGGPMIRLIEDSKLEIRLGLSESTAASLIIGDNYKFRQMNTEIKATLRSVIGKVDQNTRTVTAIFDIADGRNIRPGSLVEMTMEVDVYENGFWLPTEALAESRRGLWSAYSLLPLEGYNDLSLLSRQELQVVYTEADRVFVRGTLKDGDRVVSSGTHRLATGFLVKANQGY